MTNRYTLQVKGNTIEVLKDGSPLSNYLDNVKEVRLVELAQAIQEGKLWSGAETFVPDNFQISEEFPYLYEAQFGGESVFLTKNPTELIYSPPYPRVAETLYSVIPEGVRKSSFEADLYVNSEGVYLYEKENVIYAIDPAGDDRETRDVLILTRSHLNREIIEESNKIIDHIHKKRIDIVVGRTDERYEKGMFLNDKEVEALKDRIDVAMLAIPQLKIGGMI